MTTYFDLEKMRAFLKDFYTLTKIRITVFSRDFEELAAYPDEPAPFCRLIRSTAEGMKQCRLCDSRACAEAAQRHDTYTYRCHTGLTEAITPIYFRDEPVGYLLFGHVFSYEKREQGTERVLRRSRVYDVPQQTLAQALDQMPLLTEDYILAASHLLRAAASYLCVDRMILLSELPAQIDDYITAHLSEPLTAESLCRAFGIGKTSLWKIAKQTYGCGIAEHIRVLRLQEAKKQLREYPELSVDEVASHCGFAEYSYFITAFRRYTGLTPRAYRLSTRSSSSTVL